MVTARDASDEEDNDELRKLETRMRSDAEARQSLLQKVVAMHAPSSTLIISHNSRRLKIAATNAVRSSLASQAQVAAVTRFFSDKYRGGSNTSIAGMSDTLHNYQYQRAIKVLVVIGGVPKASCPMLEQEGNKELRQMYTTTITSQDNA